LRELQCFWVDACGVPRLLRAALEHGYMPALGGLALLVTAIGRGRAYEWRPPGWTELWAEPMLWLWLALAALIFASWADNLFNVVVGLPLHYDQPVACCG
jgi:hypothetical protein